MFFLGLIVGVIVGAAAVVGLFVYALSSPDQEPRP